MKVAIIGVRGIPVTYSGFETLAESLSVLLVQKGHELTVYGRSRYVDPKRKTYRGVKLITLPAIRGKNWESFSHSLISTIHAILFEKFDAICYFGVGNATLCLLPKLASIKTLLNVDGLDWRREKWGIAGKIFLRFSERIACFIPDIVVTDSSYIHNYYLKNYHKETHLIPYGYSDYKKKDPQILQKLKLKKGQYLLWSGRLVPDNHPEEVIQAFLQTKTKAPLVMVGDDPMESRYKNNLYKTARSDKRIIFTGFLKHDSYMELQKYCLAYIETKRSGGTHPALVEAMGNGCLIVSNNHATSKEVLGKSALFYQSGSVTSLAAKIKMLENPQKYQRLRLEAKKRAEQKYSWSKVIQLYEQVLKS